MGDAKLELVFEPHNLYGALNPVEDAPFPFGYISHNSPRAPIFELNTLLVYEREELEHVARLAAAAPEMFEALKETRDLISEGATHGFSDHAWMERLFASQGKRTRALAKAQP